MNELTVIILGWILRVKHDGFIIRLIICRWSADQIILLVLRTPTPPPWLNSSIMQTNEFQLYHVYCLWRIIEENTGNISIFLFSADCDIEQINILKMSFLISNYLLEFLILNLNK